MAGTETKSGAPVEAESSRTGETAEPLSFANTDPPVEDSDED